MKMFSLFRKKKKDPQDVAFCEVAEKAGTPEQSLIEMAIVSMIADPKKGSLHFLNATAEEPLYIPTRDEGFTGACSVNSPEEECVYLTAHSDIKAR